MLTHQEFDFLNIQWDEASQSVVMVWKSFAKGDKFRNGLDEGLELLRAKDARNWLADLRDLGTVTKDDQEWSNENWYPRAINAGVRKMAVIMPKSVISTMSVTRILTKVEKVDIETRYFDDLEASKVWLSSHTWAQPVS